MYFINYFYVSVTDDAPKCPRAELAAPNCPVAELAAPNRQRRLVPFRSLASCFVLTGGVEAAVQVGVGDATGAAGRAGHGRTRAAGARRRRPARRRQGVPQGRPARAAQDTHHGATRPGIHGVTIKVLIRHHDHRARVHCCRVTGDRNLNCDVYTVGNVADDDTNKYIYYTLCKTHSFLLIYYSTPPLRLER